MDRSEFRAVPLAIEFREADGQPPVVSGVALQYGVASEVAPGLRERFAAGAFGDVAGLDIVLNRQHDRTKPLARTQGSGLTLVDSTEALRARAELDVATGDGRDAALLLGRKVLRGFSIEFVSREAEFIGGVREVRRAALLGVALVDSPAHRGSVAQLRELAQQCRMSNPRRRYFL